MPAAAGTPRYENCRSCWLMVQRSHCRILPRSHALPWLGTSPSATFFSFRPSTIERHVSPVELAGKVERSRHIPYRGTGHAFVPIAHAGWCRHTKV